MSKSSAAVAGAAAAGMAGAAAASLAYLSFSSRPKKSPEAPPDDDSSTGGAKRTMKKLFLVKPDKDPAKAVFEVKDVPIPRPVKGEILVKMSAAAVNPSDYYGWISGAAAASKEDDPTPIGKEGSGIVVASGGGMAANRLVGKAVAVIAFNGGTYAEYICVDAMRGAFALDSTIQPETAASFFVNPYTTLAILDTAASSGSKAFIHTAAASQLGQMMVKLAPSKGMTAVNVVRRKEQVEVLEKLGAQYVVSTSDTDWKQQLSTLIQKLNIKVAFDAIAGEMSGTLLSLLPTSGTCFVYGGLSFEPVGNIDTAGFVYGRKQLVGFLLTQWIEAGGTWATIRRMRKATAEVNAGLVNEEKGWATSTFVDCTMDDMHSKFIEMWKGGFTGKKLRIRMM